MSHEVVLIELFLKLMGLIINLRESIYWKADIIGMVRAATVSFHPYSHASPEIWLCEIKEITCQGFEHVLLL